MFENRYSEKIEEYFKGWGSSLGESVVYKFECYFVVLEFEVFAVMYFSRFVIRN